MELNAPNKRFQIQTPQQRFLNRQSGMKLKTIPHLRPRFFGTYSTSYNLEFMWKCHNLLILSCLWTMNHMYKIQFRRYFLSEAILHTLFRCIPMDGFMSTATTKNQIAYPPPILSHFQLKILCKQKKQLFTQTLFGVLMFRQ